MEYHNSDTFCTISEFRMARATHVAKTVQLLFYQFLFTFGCIAMVIFYSPAYAYVLANVHEFFAVGAIGGIMMAIYIMFSAKKTETQVAIFTMFETMLVCAGTTMYGQDVVAMAFMVTVGITSALAFYALTTKNDHTGWIGPLSSALTGLLIMGFLNMFFLSNVIYTFELYVGTIVFFGYIIFDVQYFLSDRSRIGVRAREDLYIIAALNIYLDVIDIFVRLLGIIDKGKRKKRS